MTPPRGVGDAAPYNNPQGFSLRQTSAAAWGQAALHPTLPHSVGRAFARNSFTPPRRGRACPARSLAITTPFILCIVGRGLDRLTAHNERRQPAKLARSCGCLPRRGQTLFAPRFRSAQPWPHAHNPAPPRGVGDAAPYKFAANLLAACRGGIHPSRLPRPYLPPSSKIPLAKSPFPRYNTLKVKGSKGRGSPRRIASSPRVACRPGAYCEH